MSQESWLLQAYGVSNLSELPQELQQVYNGLLEFIHQYGMPKLGRWTYCKYCYKKVLPKVSFVDSLVRCSECEAGLAPLRDVIQAGSYQSWERDLQTAWRLLR